jgi:hypothetical protein
VQVNSQCYVFALFKIKDKFMRTPNKQTLTEGLGFLQPIPQRLPAVTIPPPDTIKTSQPIVREKTVRLISLLTNTSTSAKVIPMLKAEQNSQETLKIGNPEMEFIELPASELKALKWPMPVLLDSSLYKESEKYVNKEEIRHDIAYDICRKIVFSGLSFEIACSNKTIFENRIPIYFHEETEKEKIIIAGAKNVFGVLEKKEDAFFLKISDNKECLMHINKAESL